MRERERGLEAAGKDAVVGGAFRPTSSSAKRPPRPCTGLACRAAGLERAARLEQRAGRPMTCAFLYYYCQVESRRERMNERVVEAMSRDLLRRSEL